MVSPGFFFSLCFFFFSLLFFFFHFFFGFLFVFFSHHFFFHVKYKGGVFVHVQYNIHTQTVGCWQKPSVFIVLFSMERTNLIYLFPYKKSTLYSNTSHNKPYPQFNGNEGLLLEEIEIHAYSIQQI